MCVVVAGEFEKKGGKQQQQQLKKMEISTTELQFERKGKLQLRACGIERTIIIRPSIFVQYKI